VSEGARRPPGVRGDLRRLLGSGTAATLDQGLFAVANFALNLVLARWLTPGEYGVFALAFSLFLLLGTTHTAMLVEPMMVFGTGRWRDRLKAYVAVLLRGHVLFSAVAAGLLALVGVGAWAAGAHDLARTAWVLAVTSPFLLFFWLARRACWAVPAPGAAVGSAALYLVTLLGGAWGLYALDALSAVTALTAMAAASVVAGTATLLRLGMGPRGAPPDLAREALKVHWDYGRWAASTAAAGWVPTQVFFVLLPLVGGFAATAQLRAMTNLIMPMMNVVTALGFVVLPLQVARHGDRRAFRRLNLTFAGVFLAGALLYWGLLVGWGEAIVRAVYGGQYLDQLPLLAIVALVGGSLLTWAFGVQGAAAGMLAATATSAGLAWLHLVRRWRRLPDPDDATETAP
jgi:O-antigen/teichoic acid export membrane protein